MRENILYEDKAIIVAYKPAGIAVQTARLNQADMVSELKNYLRRENLKTDAETIRKNYDKEPYLGVIHRLDQPVEGILVFGKNKQVSAELSRQIQSGVMNKHYYALVYGIPEEEGLLEHYLYQDQKARFAEVVSVKSKDARLSSLKYKRLKTIGQLSLVEILLYSGRFHQIRVQMAHMGWPLAGDNKYKNGQVDSFSQIMLCAYKLGFNHPVLKKRVEYSIVPKNLDFSPFLPDKM